MKICFHRKVNTFMKILCYENLRLHDNYYAYETSSVFTWTVVVFDNYDY